MVALELAGRASAQSRTLLDLGLFDRAFERAAGDDGGEVAAGAGHGGTGDVVDDGDVVAGQGRRAVDLDAG